MVKGKIVYWSLSLYIYATVLDLADLEAQMARLKHHQYI